VSPWWREEISVQLAPAAITVVRRSRGWRRRELARHVLTVAGSEPASWPHVVEGLGAHLEAAQSRNASLCIVLRGSFVRYLVLPPVGKLSDRDALIYARQSFADLYGAAAQQWLVCLNAAVPGRPRVAAAANQEFVAALRDLARRLRLHIKSVCPELSVAVKDLVRVDGDFTGWLALIDAGHSCVARFSAGECMTIRTARYTDGAERHLLTQLEQDALCAGLDPSASELYIQSASPFEHAALHAHGWRASPLPAWSLA
jgi:hypothetical protein